MKRYSLLLLIVILSSFTTPKAIITFSGKITNTEVGKIWIKGESFEKEINLKPDGTFSEKLPIGYEGIYTIETSKNWMPIYFSKESKISLTADDSNFNTTIKYVGKGSIENQYIAKKTIITSQISSEDYKLNETEFLKKLKTIMNSVNDLFHITKFSDDYFRQKETLNLHYLEQRNLLFYNRIHNNPTNNYTVSEGFSKYDEKMDLDNESYFLFSFEYQDIVMTKFYENIKGDGTGFVSAKDAIPEIKVLKSQSIKNKLIQYSVNDINIKNTNYKNIYNEFISITNDPKIKESLTFNYNNTNNFLAVQTGEPSPTFNYENQKGGKTSLESLKGKYVYIDIWATWCVPCRQEIPFLEKVEEQFQGKNIFFVSISIDNSKDREKWSNLVIEKKMSGIQLLADKKMNSKFIKEYNIIDIPRFILIDANGNLVNSNAPRPSDPKLIELLNNLKL